MLPDVTLVIAAWNEADSILEKARNSLALAYPGGRKRIVFVTDGSTDGTPELLAGLPGIEVLHEPARRGKAAAINRAMQQVSTPVVVFTDANTMLNPDALLHLAGHFSDPETGAVSGEKKIAASVAEGAAGAGEGLYWRYESWLKYQDFRFYSQAGAAGELLALRTGLFVPIPDDTILDDFFLSMQVNLKGYRVAYEPRAAAVEPASADAGEEFKRKVRICAGGLQSVVRFLPSIVALRNARLLFVFISHRALRWTLAPLALPALLMVSALLAPNGGFYAAAFWFQVVFAALAGAGWVLESKRIRFKPLFVPFYFLMMNTAVYFGAWRFLRRTQSVLWERAVRAAPAA